MVIENLTGKIYQGFFDNDNFKLEERYNAQTIRFIARLLKPKFIQHMGLESVEEAKQKINKPLEERIPDSYDPRLTVHLGMGEGNIGVDLYYEPKFTGIPRGYVPTNLPRDLLAPVTKEDRAELLGSISYILNNDPLIQNQQIDARTIRFIANFLKPDSIEHDIAPVNQGRNWSLLKLQIPDTYTEAFTLTLKYENQPTFTFTYEPNQGYKFSHSELG